MKRYFILCFIPLLITGCFNKPFKDGVIDEITVDNGRRIHVRVAATGYGSNRQQATYDAINEAIKKAIGQKVDIRTKMFSNDVTIKQTFSGEAKGVATGKTTLRNEENGTTATIDSKTTVDANVSGKSSLNESTEQFSRNIEEYTDGLVKSYTVIDETEKAGKWCVRLEVIVIKNKADKDAERIRIAIVPFRVKNQNQKDFSDNLARKLSDVLTQTQKLAVFDREYIKEQNLEKELINDKEMPVSELSKLGNRLAVDYIVTGTVENLTNNIRTITAAGKEIPFADSGVTISFRVVDIASGMVKLANTYQTKNSQAYGKLDIEAIANSAVSSLSGFIVESLFPLYVEDVSGDTLYIGVGGGTVLKNNQQLDIVKCSGDVVDSNTGEVLGKRESIVAKAVVTEIQSKLTKAKILSSTIDLQKEYKKKAFVARIAKAEIKKEAQNPEKTTSGNTKSKSKKKSENDSDW